MSVSSNSSLISKFCPQNYEIESLIQLAYSMKEIEGDGLVAVILHKIFRSIQNFA